MKNHAAFYGADILLPKTDFEKWSVVACDQFTSEPQYWESVADIVKDKPSTFNIILPEVYLSDNIKGRIDSINSEMYNYLEDGTFTEIPDTMIFVERTLPNGKIRRGIVGAIDLKEYDFNAGSTSLIRATEGTVLERIPPRVNIRKNAPIELPHVMLLIDDTGRSVIEPLCGKNLEVVYDFDLMMDGGHLKGYKIEKNEQSRIIASLEALRGNGENPLLFAVGDGNHSLATAKVCYENNPTELNRYALVEIVNIHDEALEFEPIYRVMFGVDTDDIINEIKNKFSSSGEKEVKYITGCMEGTFYLDGLVAGVLQDFIDDYIKRHPGISVDYIHGVDVVERLSEEKNTIGFIFDGMDKSELFPYVINNGSLPRKTFSMGEAASKRYYMECRRIDPLTK